MQLTPVTEADLAGVDAAINLTNDSGQPYYRSGMTMLINRKKPVKVGDFVMVSYPGEFLVKSVTAVLPNGIVVADMRGLGAEVFPISQVQRIMLIAGTLLPGHEQSVVQDCKSVPLLNPNKQN
jgi:hypothetical protein